MRVRVAVRSLNALWRERRLLNPIKFGWYSWQLWSHKALRYFSPVFWICALVTNAMLADIPFYAAILIVQGIVLGLGCLGWFWGHGSNGSALLSKPYYLLLANAASLMGIYRFMRGERMITWKPVR